MKSVWQWTLLWPVIINKTIMQRETSKTNNRTREGHSKHIIIIIFFLPSVGVTYYYYIIIIIMSVLSMHWHRWLSDRKDSQTVKNLLWKSQKVLPWESGITWSNFW